ncbi:DUF4124 domain-containing protein [Oleiagrimonas sp. C23AA]|uniref:DUF4124 domain-containing protein n=1 Tax=Oleiagrimonas sp. C23AA TaxID=2719047 RepID=UPI0014239C91|nr:DUF4124 domain-containing protein [Oleiagrimonas sp. C23AA]NII11967.1 DUF4124 domain-containing protein [Oleiagrimonas sp. C23AA]
MSATLALIGALMLAPQTQPAHTAYRCVDASGHIAFQDHPCSRHERQHKLSLHHFDDPAPAPASTAPPPAPVPPAKPSAAPATPTPAPPPVLWRCQRATDGKSYVSWHGPTPAYRAPLGMLDAYQNDLGQIYRPHQLPAGSVATTGIRPGMVTPGMIGSRYVWVQDRCRRLSRSEACQVIQHEWDATQERIRKAFESDRPPLQKQAEHLRQAMAGCGR